MIKKAEWQELSEKLLQKTRVFDLYVSRMRSEEKNFEDDFYRLKVPNWTNIIALTEKREVVMVRQFRFGTRGDSLELPGGIVDSNESPKAAALRELTEETGYHAKDAIEIASLFPNPALQDNRCFIYFTDRINLAGEQNLDQTESISVEHIPLEQIPQMIVDGRMNHAIMISAFASLFCRGLADFPGSAQSSTAKE